MKPYLKISNLHILNLIYVTRRYEVFDILWSKSFKLMVYDPRKNSLKRIFGTMPGKGLVANQLNHWSIAGVSTCYTSQDPTAGTQKWWVWCRWVSFWVKIHQVQNPLRFRKGNTLLKPNISPVLKVFLSRWFSFSLSVGYAPWRMLGLRQKQIWWCPCVLLAFRRETSGTFVQQKSRKGFPMEWLLGLTGVWWQNNTKYRVCQEHEPFMMPQVVIFTQYLQDKWYSWALGTLQNQHSPPSLREFFGRLLNWSKNHPRVYLIGVYILYILLFPFFWGWRVSTCLLSGSNRTTVTLWQGYGLGMSVFGSKIEWPLVRGVKLDWVGLFVYVYIYICIYIDYFREFSGKSRLVKYYDLARYSVIWILSFRCHFMMELLQRKRNVRAI